VDLLVEFEKGQKPGFAFFDMQAELSRSYLAERLSYTPQFPEPILSGHCTYRSRGAICPGLTILCNLNLGTGRAE